MKLKAFSLIELLVVIAIVGVLSAIAVPAYTSYQVKANISSSIQTIDGIIKRQMLDYARTGVLPSTISVNGYTWSGGWAGANLNNYQNIAAMLFQNFSSGSLKSIMIVWSLSNLNGIPGFTSTDGATGTYNTIAYAIRDTGNGTFTTACGQYHTNQGTSTVPSTYLPPNCRCNSVLLFQQGNTCGTF